MKRKAAFCKWCTSVGPYHDPDCAKLAEYKERSICNNCGGRGHWAGDCASKRRKTVMTQAVQYYSPEIVRQEPRLPAMDPTVAEVVEPLEKSTGRLYPIYEDMNDDIVKSIPFNDMLDEEAKLEVELKDKPPKAQPLAAADDTSEPITARSPGFAAAASAAMPDMPVLLPSTVAAQCVKERRANRTGEDNPFSITVEDSNDAILTEFSDDILLAKARHAEAARGVQSAVMHTSPNGEYCQWIVGNQSVEVTDAKGNKRRLTWSRLYAYLYYNECSTSKRNVSHLCHMPTCIRKRHIIIEPAGVNNLRRSCYNASRNGLPFSCVIQHGLGTQSCILRAAWTDAPEPPMIIAAGDETTIITATTCVETDTNTFPTTDMDAID